MHPLSSLRCASRVLTALAAISGILLTVGCGGSSSPPPNQNGFSNSSLSGTYVLSSSGVDVGGAPLALAGAFKANGDGTIASGGTIDVVDPVIPPGTPAQAITSASYSIGSDGRGQIKLNTAVANFVLAVVLTSSSHGLVSEFDANGTGSGTIDLQTATITSLSQISGPYAFILGGADINGNPMASTGAFVNTSADGVQTGIQDFNDSYFPFLSENMFASASLGAGGTAPLSISLSTTTFPGMVLDFYPISATQWKLIETDYTEFLSGDVFTQTGASIPNSNMVFTMAGGSVVGVPVAIGGLMTSNGSGGFSLGLADINNDGNPSPAQIAFSGTPVGGAGFGGRVQVNIVGDLPGANTVWVIYPSAGGLLMMEGDQNAVTAGVGYAQTATTFTSGTSVGYGLNLTGFNGLAVDNIAQFNAAAAGTTPNVTGKLDENDQGAVIGGLTLTGTYTPDAGSTGRGSILVPAIGTVNGGLGLAYYVVNSGSALVVELDPTQATSGTFQLQATPGADAANAATPVRPLFAKVHVKTSAKAGSKKSQP
jgi:hypothetical protein